MSNSAFTDWFVAQHGKRNCVLLSPSNPSDAHLRSIIREGEIAKAALDHRERWDAKEESALYAWNARKVLHAETLKELRTFLTEHPAYADLTEAQEVETGGDTASFSYLVRLIDSNLKHHD